MVAGANMMVDPGMIRLMDMVKVMGEVMGVDMVVLQEDMVGIEEFPMSTRQIHHQT